MIRFQSAGRIWGFWNDAERQRQALELDVSIRRADLGLLELTHSGRNVRRSVVSIRRADLGLLELGPSSSLHVKSPGFQSAGRIWGFWNQVGEIVQLLQALFQSAGRIWGFWNTGSRIRHIIRCYGFNPPGGFGAFGTD